ncbi:MAG: hypothetical protein KatS3mg083_134 [Candidatus Dojkabacteria bacterium]|nr:MAG: hypothetical protein KatS3mg083_134 [Candidatus Dojkabacteria bacterium]
MITINRKIKQPFYILHDGTVIGKIYVDTVVKNDKTLTCIFKIAIDKNYQIKRLGRPGGLPEEEYNAILEYEQKLANNYYGPDRDK